LPQTEQQSTSRADENRIPETKLAEPRLNNTEMMGQLFAKMEERLEQKYQDKAGVLPPCGPPRYRANKANVMRMQGKNEDEIEDSLHEQVMSNTCPICFELFLPPDHSPFILFPCGHTFCKVCIK
jgi:hypothetical protein